MNTNRTFRLIATAAIVILPLVLAGCASSHGGMKLVNKGFNHIEKGELVDAETVLTEAVQKYPDNPYAVLDLGTVYQRTGRFDRAREMFEKVIAMDAKDKPSRRSKFVDSKKNLTEIAQDNLKTLPPKQ
jgi:Flp pilus assembly protein TadD